MPINFSDLVGENEEPLIHPRDVFLTLTRDSKFSFPRDIQTEVMEKWFEARDQAETVLKLNVGSGKTVVGLLLLQSSLNEGKGPCLYVTPDNQLAQQCIKEAKALGIDTVEDPRDSRYGSGDAICVVNIYKVFNGRSVFGLESSRIDIGTVIIDDAHACVSTLTQQFRIQLASNHPAYKKIFAALAEDLKGYSRARFLEIESGDPRSYLEVPFWSWDARQIEILRALSDHRGEGELEFVYPLLKDLLRQSRCIVGGQRLEIEPWFPAVNLFQSFRRAKRRIYMTATLADDSVIITHFGVDSSKLGKPIVPSLSQSMGDRMIILPQELNSSISVSDIRNLLVELAKTVNVVAIVPSKKAAADWDAAADQVLIGDEVAEGVDKLRHGHVGLTVLINRYDGIDLPGDACRVLALIDLPEVNSYAEMVDGQTLSATTVNLRRQIERIEQGMGRGVRSNDDYCVVFLVGSRLVSRIRSQDGEAMLTPATRAQVLLSRRIAKKLGAPSIDQIREVAAQCLSRDADWIKVSKRALVGLKPDNEFRFDPAKLALRSAFDLARAGRNEEAVSVIDLAVDSTSDQAVKAWLLAKKAAIQHTFDPIGAQRTLGAAYDFEPSILRPLHGAKYKKLSPAAGQQASQLIANHQGRFVDPIQMQLFADGLCSDLVFMPDTSGKFEAAIQDLAWFLGISAQRPDKDYGEGPDNLWALPGGTYLVIECKNGVTSGDGIAKRDMGQLEQAVSWFNDRYLGAQIIPVMVHPSRLIGEGASPVAGMRVIEADKLERIRTKLRALAGQLANPSIASNAVEVAARLAQNHFHGNGFIDVFTLEAKS
jgi:hypothetical protein